MNCSNIDEMFMATHYPVFFAAPGSGVRALRRDSRATKTEPRNRGGRTESERKSGKAGASVDAKAAANNSDELEVTKGERDRS